MMILKCFICSTSVGQSFIVADDTPLKFSHFVFRVQQPVRNILVRRHYENLKWGKII